MGQFELIEERAAIRWDTSTMWASREWHHFQRRKLAQAYSIVHAVFSETRFPFSRPRPRLPSSKSQHRD
jgi:hypothetical protein